MKEPAVGEKSRKTLIGKHLCPEMLKKDLLHFMYLEVTQRGKTSEGEKLPSAGLHPK